MKPSDISPDLFYRRDAKVSFGRSQSAGRGNGSWLPVLVDGQEVGNISSEMDLASSGSSRAQKYVIVAYEVNVDGVPDKTFRVQGSPAQALAAAKAYVSEHLK